MKSKSKKSKIAPSFSIIRKMNSLNSAETLDGITVKRKEKIYIPAWERFVMCAPYDNHFIYEDISGKPNRWAHMCTCGGMAVVVGANVYKKDASPTSGPGIMPGEMLICKHHADFGKHSDGSS